MNDQAPPLDPHPLSDYVAWAGRRNRDAILATLGERLENIESDVLEFASGSGMHSAYFAPNFAKVRFHPSDKTDETFESIKRLRSEYEAPNVQDPMVLDLTAESTWPDPEQRRFAAIFCINIFQVAPVAIARGMMKCASRLLTPEGFLMIYGPFKVSGEFTTDSNREFHQKLQSANVPEWGLKDVADLEAAAAANGLSLREKVDMPVNNFSLVFQRA